MHISSDNKNFRNKKYLKEMENEFKRMFRSYHKYLAYKNKLANELTMSEEDKSEMSKIDMKICKNIERANERIKKEDFKNVL